MNDLASVILERLDEEQFTVPEPGEVKALRERLKLNVKEAAKLMNISRRTWERYESGSQKMNKSSWFFLLLIADEVQGFSVLNIGG